MIKGKAKMEFGTGDIRMTSVLSGGVGALCCATQDPHEIGEKVAVDDTWSESQSEVIMIFTKVESIDALIEELKAARDMMTGDYAGPLDERDEMDFDAFLN